MIIADSQLYYLEYKLTVLSASLILIVNCSFVILRCPFLSVRILRFMIENEYCILGCLGMIFR